MTERRQHSKSGWIGITASCRPSDQLQAVRKDKRSFLNLTRLNLKEASRKVTGTLILGARA